jgi:predicted transcriptional regulator
MCVEKHLRDIMDWDDVPVTTAMSAPLRELQRDRSVTEAARVLCEEQIGSVLVRGTPDGIVTDTDIVRAVKNGRDLDQTMVVELASSPLVTVSAAKTLQDAAELMHDHGLKKVVVTDDGEHVGIVTTTDIVEQVSPELDDIIGVFSMD